MHTNPSKELDSLVNMLLAQAETDRDRRETKREARENGERGIDMERGPRPERQYLSLRRILRFSFQHPPLLFPAVQFQRVLRRKIIGESCGYECWRCAIDPSSVGVRCWLMMSNGVTNG